MSVFAGDVPACGGIIDAVEMIDHYIDGAELVTKRDGKARVRRGIFEAWGNGCAYCGCPADTLDHVRPLARGGLTVRENLIPACSSCNLAKSDNDWINWFRGQVFWDHHRETRVAVWLKDHLNG